MVVEVHTHIGSVPTTWRAANGWAEGPSIETWIDRFGSDPTPLVRLIVRPGARTIAPADARKLAVLLCQAADRADGHPTVVRDVSRDAIDQRGEPLGPPQRHSDSLEWISKGGLP